MSHDFLRRKALTSIQSTLASQSTALASVYAQYLNDEFVQEQTKESIRTLFTTSKNGGKIIFCGVGKSFKIASKLLATANSLSIHATTLHPTEALHGDLGIVKPKDSMIMISASGNTPELLNLIPHIPYNIPIILLTCNRNCKLAPYLSLMLLVDLPTFLTEEHVHGLPAPTVTTTLSLSVGDASIIALLEILEEDLALRRRLFSERHPGGSIGANMAHLNDNVTKRVNPTSNSVIPLALGVYSSSLSPASNGKGSSLPIFSTVSSNSSYLSLYQLRQEIAAQGACTSPVSIGSEIDVGEGILTEVNNSTATLQEQLMKAHPSYVLLFKDWGVVTVELLFQWTVLYDYLVFHSEHSKMAIPSSDLKKLLRLHYNVVPTEQIMDIVKKSFKEVII
ncbi:uncharacterized protein KQ657_003712 [Scheffersomyces spartinae]|uniref:SIS domain-containing protein n=1 Tax=Scheffersomyces spartinae TaxID=45513 RepID=A0A9P7VC70_9ASCO|nr:uncharacterized protein KQ657_003712 [Scheffersomyces spartinae]KAG7195187.1 hypothetical protein KQ657_003712 [Scheffersomyces spartinae]